MPCIRSHSTLTVSLLLSYLLVMLLCTPFATAAGSSFPKKSNSATQDSTARYRDGEILVRFREGVSQRDKETIVATHGMRRRNALQGESGLERVELLSGRDVK